MTKTEKAAKPTHTPTLFKKDWKIVVFFGERFSLGKSTQVLELPSSKEHFRPLTTDAILSVDIIKDEFSMFNTGPCRYIGFNALYYNGHDLPMAFTRQVPTANAPLDMEVVSLNTNNSNLVNTSVFVTKVLKLKENLFQVFTEQDDYYFVTVE